MNGVTVNQIEPTTYSGDSQKSPTKSETVRLNFPKKSTNELVRVFYVQVNAPRTYCCHTKTSKNSWENSFIIFFCQPNENIFQ